MTLIIFYFFSYSSSLSAFLCAMAAICINHLLVLFLLLGILDIKLSHGQNFAPVASPFFFLCQYHHDLDQPGGIQGEIALSVSIKGNPEYYEPGKVYEGIYLYFIIYFFLILKCLLQYYK